MPPRRNRSVSPNEELAPLTCNWRTASFVETRNPSLIWLQIYDWMKHFIVGDREKEQGSVINIVQSSRERIQSQSRVDKITLVGGPSGGEGCQSSNLVIGI